MELEGCPRRRCTCTLIWQDLPGGPGRMLTRRPVVRHFHPFQYGAGSWTRKETVIARVEATSLGSDARFVVTNLSRPDKHLYERVYCARGKMENLIKNIKLYTRSDKTACHR